jgi:hypothetical protein
MQYLVRRGIGTAEQVHDITILTDQVHTQASFRPIGNPISNK